MFRLIKTLAPLVLVIFFSTVVVGTGWGEENKINFEVKVPESPFNPIVEENFNVDINFLEDVLGKDLNLNIEFPAEFNQQAINTLITAESYRFTVKAPSQEGDYILHVKILSPNNEVLSHKNVSLKVVRPIWKTTGADLYIGSVIIILGIAYLLVVFFVKTSSTP